MVLRLECYALIAGLAGLVDRDPPDLFGADTQPIPDQGRLAFEFGAAGIGNPYRIRFATGPNDHLPENSAPGS
jgi:hypothetical protein